MNELIWYIQILLPDNYKFFPAPPIFMPSYAYEKGGKERVGEHSHIISIIIIVIIANIKSYSEKLSLPLQTGKMANLSCNTILSFLAT